MGVREALKKLGKILLGAIPFLLGVAVAVIMRRSPDDPAKQPQPKAPDMGKADENAEKLEVAQEKLDQQHADVEQALAQKPAPKKSDTLQDAVNAWNEGKR